MVTAPVQYGWTWIEGEDDNAGDSWIQISPLDEEGYAGEEMAVIMCRNYDDVAENHPEWISQKIEDAKLIVAALNASTRNLS